MKRLLGMEWVGGRLEKTWCHYGDDGRKKITVECIQDVEPAMDEAKFIAQNRSGKSDLRFVANVAGTHVEDACRIACNLSHCLVLPSVGLSSMGMTTP
jgi:hypothetical protein